MKKLVNDPLLVVEEMIDGLLLADERLSRIEDENVVLRRDHDALASEGKVAIISGGGAGHEPAHAGYVGRGMLTAVTIGAVFTSPSVDAVLAAIRTVAGPAGVLLIIKNYTGDRLNFGLAAEFARAEGIAVEAVIVRDDVALDDHGPVGRRGIAGTVLVHKIAGAAAEAGLSLVEVKAEAEAASDAVFSMGLGLGSCIVPAAGKRSFELADDEVEYGLGIHGESGARRGPVLPADMMLDQLLDRLVACGGMRPNDRTVLLVNNLGGTAAQELNIVARHALLRLRNSGIRTEAVLVGSFLTALEMPGVSISLLRVDARRLERLLAPTEAGAWMAPTRPAEALHTFPANAVGAHATEPSGAPWNHPDDKARFKGAVAKVCSALKGAEQRLTDLDSVVGDGDMGISLARGARAVEQLLPSLDMRSPAAALREISATLRRSLGGTSGPLYALFLLRSAATLADARAPTGAGRWVAAFRAGGEAMQELGGARAGDRTMLDALLPAAEAMEEALHRDQGAAAILQAAVAAAERGVEATKAMAPRLGRSSYVGSRALGHPDPGAAAVAVWLRAVASTIA